MASYTPFEEMDRMLDEMDRRMSTLRRSLGGPARTGLPAGREQHGAERETGGWPAVGRLAGGDRSWSGGLSMDLGETDDGYLLVVDLPGFETEEIALSSEDGVLRVDAEHAVTDEKVARSRRVHERLSMPAGVVEDEITATYRNGVLEVSLPVDADDADDGRHIEIRD